MADAHVTLGNQFITLEFLPGTLRATNHRSGSVTEFALPGFAVVMAGEEIPGSRFGWQEPEAASDRVTLRGECSTCAMTAEVSYLLAEDEPWFRKQVTLRATQPLQTPDRVIVDVQETPPAPIRRVGYGIRGGPGGEEIEDLATYAPQPGCGYPVWAGDWFAGLEHPAAFAVPRERLELYHHPVWDEEGVIASFSAVFGVAGSHEQVAEAFMDYLWRIRKPRLEQPFVTFTSGWSTMPLGGGEYIDCLASNEAFLRSIVELGLRPDGMGIDAGYFDRQSLFRLKEDPDDSDALFIRFGEQVREAGMELSVWVSHNGRTGMDMEWIKQQGWETGSGPGSYPWGEYVVMMQPGFEEALAKRFSEIVGRAGAKHLKIDWDNECATNGHFTERYPSYDHVREASILAFNRIERAMRKANPDLITRNGWWPSPWWLQHADHVWLASSGDGEYAALPSRTMRDRDNTHRDEMYYQHLVRAETPFPNDAYDNHGFAHALANPFREQPHTWVDNAVLQFMRGSTYLHMAVCPESLTQWEADQVQQVLDWLHYHAAELGTRGTRIVGGSPASGAIYGYLHPSADSAWLVLRNPSPQPQAWGDQQRLSYELGWVPGTWRQVYPYWQDLPQLRAITMLGHEVRLLRLEREELPDASPIPGAPFMARAVVGGTEYLFPGARPMTDGIGPTLHPDMQIPEIIAEPLGEQSIADGVRMGWYCGIPHRFAGGEMLVTVRGAEADLDSLTVCLDVSRYRTGGKAHRIAAERIFRNEQRGYGTSFFLPPLGARERDDYAFSIPDGGWCSLMLSILGEGAARVRCEPWITGWEGPARRTIVRAEAPMDGPLPPIHPYGFSRCLKL
ncbi:MAG TPA: hypothetical protein DEP45_00085 [Armatimonadetes bacterium]|nr:hypothetical protein [Armatimonadota bacterium]